jgi:hypothetical protein
MSNVLPADRPVRLLIRRMAVHSSSSIDARRLADGLVPALELALNGSAVFGPDRVGSGRAAEAIVAAVEARLREMRT